jgi:hypothetical protein
MESDELGEYSGLYCWLCVSMPVELLPHSSLGTCLVISSSCTAIASGGADFPYIPQLCLLNFLHAVDSAPCNIDAKDHMPILQFSSIYCHVEILPHMLAMPMPALNLPCFMEWLVNRRVCLN